MATDKEVQLKGLDIKVYQTPSNILWLELEDICDHIKSEQKGSIRIPNIRRCLTNDRDNVHKHLGLTGTKIPLDCLISFTYKNTPVMTFVASLRHQ